MTLALTVAWCRIPAIKYIYPSMQDMPVWRIINANQGIHAFGTFMIACLQPDHHISVVAISILPCMLLIGDL